MRVLIVHTYHYARGGDSTYAFSLAELLRSHGHEVHFFSMHHPENYPSPDSQYFVDYIDYPGLLRRGGIRSAARVLARSLYSREARRRIARMLNAVRPDIAHLQSIHAHITPSVIHELAAHQVPIVWTLHDYKLICPNTHLLAHGSICEACRGGAFYHALLKRCKKSSRAASAVVTAEAYLHRALRITRLVHRFVSPSRFLIDKFAEFGWSRSRLVHIRNFLEHRHFIQERAAERGYVLYLGQVEPWKGLRHLLDAMERLPGTELRVAGEGSDRTTCERLVAERGLSNVRFLGRLSMYQVQEAIDGSSVGVVPSVCYENCPYTVMEFMAAGKPVVASNLGGIPELVEDGKTGFLVPPGDSAYLARSIGELIEKPAVRAAMGEVARRRAGEWFAPERHYEAVSALYQDLIGRTGRVGAAKR